MVDQIPPAPTPEASARYGEALAELVAAEEAIRSVKISLESWYREYQSMIGSNRGYMRNDHERTSATLASHAREYSARAIARIEEANRVMWGPFHD